MPGKRKIVEVALLDPERFTIRHEDGSYMVVSTYDLLDVPVVEPLGSATFDSDFTPDNVLLFTRRRPARGNFDI